MLRSIGVFAAILGAAFGVLGLMRISGLMVSWHVADQLALHGFWEFFTASAVFLTVAAVAFGCERITSAIMRSGQALSGAKVVQGVSEDAGSREPEGASRPKPIHAAPAPLPPEAEPGPASPPAPLAPAPTLGEPRTSWQGLPGAGDDGPDPKGES
ncbi:MAG: hypothetical protein MI723_15165 [Caulobacterales bacterium]|nr:hypothetical protein [Caulobacterales bacterium]